MAFQQQLELRGKGKFAAGKGKMLARKVEPAAEGVKKVRRAKPGAAALREIRKYQRKPVMHLQVMPFRRLLVNHLKEYKKQYRITPQAIEAAMEAAQAYGVDFFSAMGEAAVHAKRITSLAKDADYVARTNDKLKPGTSYNF